MNLQNAEATFGKDSPQYVDILEIIEHYMSTIDDREKDETGFARKDGIKPALEPSLTGVFANLAIRPKN